MSGSIREAMEAAGEATWQRIDLLGYEVPDSAEARKIARAAIAAFLRALPDHSVMQSLNQPPVPGSIGSGSLHTIAAAVEAEGE
jgi:hypothetical protein